MNRRKFIAGLFAVPFVALFGKLAKAEKTLPRMEPTYYGRYAYSWRVEDRQMRDFTAIPEIDGKFTFPHRTEGYNCVVPGPDGEPDTWYDTEGRVVFPFDYRPELASDTNSYAGPTLADCKRKHVTNDNFWAGCPIWVPPPK